MSQRTRLVRTTLLLCSLLSFLASSGPTAFAEAGDLDHSFGSDGRVVTRFGSYVQDRALAVARQTDGKIVAAGVAGSDGNPAFGLARYNIDGSLDPSFGVGGKVTTDFPEVPSGYIHADEAFDVAIQRDGKIVAAGHAGDYHAFGLARYNTDGTLDASFGGDGRVTTRFRRSFQYAAAVLIYGDGKILAVGSVNQENTALARYSIDGSRDPSFGGGDGKLIRRLLPHSEEATAAVLQPNGKIVLAGIADLQSALPHISKFFIARLLRNGDRDTSFSHDGAETTVFGLGESGASDVIVQGDGKIVAAGYAGQRFGLARYRRHGQLDPTFEGDGTVTTKFALRSYASGIAIQANGSITAAGPVGTGLLGPPRFGLARYTPRGKLAVGFGSGGKVTTRFALGDAYAYALLIAPNRKIVVVGEAGSRFALARYLPA